MAAAACVHRAGRRRSRRAAGCRRVRRRGSNTLANVARAVGGLDLPDAGGARVSATSSRSTAARRSPGAPAVAGRLLERSKGKDTTTGHWELMGVVTPQAMPTYPYGFPDEVIDPFMNRTGRGVLGNKPASGTEIIQELGEEHQRTGKWIVYTSADSVFQIAAHEETVPLEELYDACRTAREILTGKHAVGRVIARPFVGRARDRTSGRRTGTISRSSPGARTTCRSYGRPARRSTASARSATSSPTRTSTRSSRRSRMSRAFRRSKNCFGRSTTGWSSRTSSRRTRSGATATTR